MLTRKALLEKLGHVFEVAVPQEFAPETAGEVFEWLHYSLLPQRYSKQRVSVLAASRLLCELQGQEFEPLADGLLLESLFPVEDRAEMWQRFRRQIPFHVPYLQYGPLAGAAYGCAVVVATFVSGILWVIVAVGVTIYWRIPGLLFLLCWLVNIIAIFCWMTVPFRRYERCFPGDMRTVSDLAERWLFWAQIQRSDYVPEHAALWMFTRQFIAQTAVCRLDVVRRDTALEDLGLQ